MLEELKIKKFHINPPFNQNNINAVVFAYSSFKHLAAGLIPGVSFTDELIASVRHLKNMYAVLRTAKLIKLLVCQRRHMDISLLK